MANIKVLFEERKILLASGFAKKAQNASSKEAQELADVKRLYPRYKVVVNHIAKNPKKECYKGLTYEYMRAYISVHASNRELALEYFDELLLRTKCHSQAHRYPVVKQWFLSVYPQVDMVVEPLNELVKKNNFMLEEVA